MFLSSGRFGRRSSGSNGIEFGVVMSGDEGYGGRRRGVRLDKVMKIHLGAPIYDSTVAKHPP